MLKIYMKSMNLTYAGCPASGLAAIDWRRAHGLRDRPDDFAANLNLCHVSDEALCRLAAKLLDKDADLMLSGRSYAVSLATARTLLALPPDWQREDAPLTQDEREALAELIRIRLG